MCKKNQFSRESEGSTGKGTPVQALTAVNHGLKINDFFYGRKFIATGKDGGREERTVDRIRLDCIHFHRSDGSSTWALFKTLNADPNFRFIPDSETVDPCEDTNPNMRVAMFSTVDSSDVEESTPDDIEPRPANPLAVVVQGVSVDEGDLISHTVDDGIVVEQRIHNIDRHGRIIFRDCSSVETEELAKDPEFRLVEKAHPPLDENWPNMAEKPEEPKLEPTVSFEVGLQMLGDDTMVMGYGGYGKDDLDPIDTDPDEFGLRLDEDWDKAREMRAIMSNGGWEELHPDQFDDDEDFIHIQVTDSLTWSKASVSPIADTQPNPVVTDDKEPTVPVIDPYDWVKTTLALVASNQPDVKMFDNILQKEGAMKTAIICRDPQATQQVKPPTGADTVPITQTAVGSTPTGQGVRNQMVTPPAQRGVKAKSNQHLLGVGVALFLGVAVVGLVIAFFAINTGEENGSLEDATASIGTESPDSNYYFAQQSAGTNGSSIPGESSIYEEYHRNDMTASANEPVEEQFFTPLSGGQTTSSTQEEQETTSAEEPSPATSPVVEQSESEQLAQLVVQTANLDEEVNEPSDIGRPIMTNRELVDEITVVSSAIGLESSRIDNVNSRITELGGQIQRVDGELGGLRRADAEHQSRFNTATRQQSEQLSRLESQIERLPVEGNITELQNEIARLERELEVERNQRADLTRTTRGLQEEIQNLRAELENTQQERSVSAEQISEITSHLESINRGLEERQERIEVDFSGIQRERSHCNSECVLRRIPEDLRRHYDEFVDMYDMSNEAAIARCQALLGRPNRASYRCNAFRRWMRFDQDDQETRADAIWESERRIYNNDDD